MHRPLGHRRDVLIYDYVPGRIIADATAAQSLSGAEAGRLSAELAGALAGLHAVPAPEAEPGRSRSSIGYLRRQVTRWTDQWQRNQTTELPAFARLAGWLTEEVGRLSEDYPATFVHGDYRLDNLVLDPSSLAVRAVLDWEMSTFGDPLMDLALLLAYWEQPGDVLRQHVNVARGLTFGSGFWSRDRILEVYLAQTGLPPDHLDACLGRACLKLATIMEGINYRHRAGQALDDLSAGLTDAALGPAGDGPDGGRRQGPGRASGIISRRLSIRETRPGRLGGGIYDRETRVECELDAPGRRLMGEFSRWRGGRTCTSSST